MGQKPLTHITLRNGERVRIRDYVDARVLLRPGEVLTVESFRDDIDMAVVHTLHVYDSDTRVRLEHITAEKERPLLPPIDLPGYSVERGLFHTVLLREGDAWINRGGDVLVYASGRVREELE